MSTEYRSTFVPEPGSLEIFLDGGTVLVNLATGEAVVELVRPRRGLQEANAMHLNQVGGLWTALADLYAVILLVVAVTGLFVIKGKKGITGRGAWLTAAGTVFPLILFFLYS